MSSNMPPVDILGLTKSFGTNKAVDNLTLQVAKGEIYGFLGPNGAGKTTTIRLLLGILRPDVGDSRLFGEQGATVQARRRLGYLSSDMALDEDLTGRQYLTYLSNMYGKNCDLKIKELAGRLEAKLDVKIASYSRGNRQKLVLIAALMHEPDLLIMDEPTSGFDPLVQETFIQIIRGYRASGGTVFMSSHILSEVQDLCDRVGFIKNGKLVTESSVGDVGAAPRKFIQVKGWKNKKGSLRGLREVKRADGVVTLSYEGEVVSLLQYFAGQKLQDITIQPPDLEEEFMDYYQSPQEKRP